MTRGSGRGIGAPAIAGDAGEVEPGFLDRLAHLVQPKSRVVVTGGSGFIGSNLVHALATGGASVHNLDVCPPRDPRHRRAWHEIDLLDARALSDHLRAFEPRLVFHLAARTDLDGRTLADYAVNVAGVENLLAGLDQVPSVERLIVTSSQLVCRPGYAPTHDNDYAPHTVYGQSKIETERVTRSWRDAACAWTLVRPTSIWGPWFDVPYRDFFLAVASGRFLHVRGRDPVRSFGFVGNVVGAYLALTWAPAELVHGRLFYLADLAPVRLREWANLVQREIGSAPIREVPEWTMRVAARVGDGLQRLGWRSPPLTSFRLSNMVGDNVVDMDHLRRVGAGAMPYGLEEGVRITIRWLRQAGHLNSTAGETVPSGS